MKAGKPSVAFSCLLAVCAVAQAPHADSFQVITPVFHQLVAYSLPAGFQLNPPEQVNAKSYLRETVLKGETPEHWTQMITLTGANGAVAAGLTAQRMVETVGNGYRSACPKTFSVENVGSLEISGQSGYLALLSCGSVPDEGGAPGAVHSESAVILAIAGAEDMYTLQWAERAHASNAPLPFDDAKWQARMTMLKPIRICTRVQGEKEPYPSCLAKK